MTKVEIETVLTIFDRKASEFKRFGSSHRRIQAIRDELEKEFKPDITQEDSFKNIHERVRQTDAMNVQEAIEKRIKEIDEIIERYEESISNLESELANELVRHKQTSLCQIIDVKQYHLYTLKEIRRELEAIINVSTGSDRENGS